MILRLHAGYQSLSVTGMVWRVQRGFHTIPDTLVGAGEGWSQPPLPPQHNREALPRVLSSRAAGLLAQPSMLPLARWERLVFLTSR